LLLYYCGTKQILDKTILIGKSHVSTNKNLKFVQYLFIVTTSDRARTSVQPWWSRFNIICHYSNDRLALWMESAIIIITYIRNGFKICYIKSILISIEYIFSRGDFMLRSNWLQLLPPPESMRTAQNCFPLWLPSRCPCCRAEWCSRTCSRSPWSSLPSSHKSHGTWESSHAPGTRGQNPPRSTRL
jgi:hypothetical protein